jgi:hypothetical protein
MHEGLMHEGLMHEELMRQAFNQDPKDRTRVLRVLS